VFFSNEKRIIIVLCCELLERLKNYTRYFVSVMKRRSSLTAEVFRVLDKTRCSNYVSKHGFSYEEVFL